MSTDPEKRKAAVGKTTALQKIEMLPGKFEHLEDSPNAALLQALSIRRRFPLSWPVARAVAEIHFGRVA